MECIPQDEQYEREILLLAVHLVYELDVIRISGGLLSSAMFDKEMIKQFLLIEIELR